MGNISLDEESRAGANARPYSAEPVRVPVRAISLSRTAFLLWFFDRLMEGPTPLQTVCAYFTPGYPATEMRRLSHVPLR